ncbi:MAG: BON domain-containing protein [Alphaproteobacteria bacterium]
MTARLARTRLVALVAVATFGGCVSAVTGVATFAVDAAYTATEERTANDVFNDTKIRLALKQHLFNADIDLFKDVDTIIYQRRVLLVGSVDTEAARVRAGELAAKPRGVREVINEIQVSEGGGVGSFVGNMVIEKMIQSAYFFDQMIDSANFRVRSVNGVVYLIGLAGSEAELDKALSTARTTKGVRRVVNYVRIEPAGV